jgi:hypothetical protein
METLTSCLLQAACPESSKDTTVEQLLKLYLSQIKTSNDVAKRIDDVCLLEDAGDLVTHLLQVLAGFASYLAHGPPSNYYVERQICDSAEEDGLSDLGIVDYLDDKHAGLKYAGLQ